MTLIELKAKAYDCLAQLEYWQKELDRLNNQITNYKEKQPEKNDE